jgi:hypothetical protein
METTVWAIAEFRIRNKMKQYDTKCFIRSGDLKISSCNLLKKATGVYIIIPELKPHPLPLSHGKNSFCNGGAWTKSP